MHEIAITRLIFDETDMYEVAYTLITQPSTYLYNPARVQVLSIYLVLRSGPVMGDAGLVQAWVDLNETLHFQTT